ncbi:hypothetical protein BCT84_02210 [Vibrio breoganii]|nr:hypothetical protein BCT84_02210 [Vibrio breoganii]
MYLIEFCLSFINAIVETLGFKPMVSPGNLASTASIWLVPIIVLAFRANARLNKRLIEEERAKG